MEWVRKPRKAIVALLYISQSFVHHFRGIWIEIVDFVLESFHLGQIGDFLAFATLNVQE